MKTMNAFGIDYQQTLTVVCLREGRGISGAARSIGDGQRSVFPNAVARRAQAQDGIEKNLWASDALLEGVQDQAQGNALDAGPWKQTEGAERFWRGLHTRIYNYLGRCEPTLRNGYRLLVAVPEREGACDSREVQQITMSAGLPEVVFLSSVDALLCRWIGQIGRVTVEQQVTVAVIAVGDTATQVAAYRVIAPEQGIARPVARRNAPILLQIGHVTWMQRLRAEIAKRLPEPLSDSYELSTRDACLEFAARLSRTEADETLTWHGPGRGRLTPPLELEPRDCGFWSDNSDLDRLPEIVAETTAGMSGNRQPDLILVGGVGAVWPFVAQRARLITPVVWQSGIPHQDLAWGATLWPEIGEGIDLPNVIRGGRGNPEPTPRPWLPVESVTPEPMEWPDLPEGVTRILHGEQERDQFAVVEEPVSNDSDRQSIHRYDFGPNFLNPHPEADEVTPDEDARTIFPPVDETQKW